MDNAKTIECSCGQPNSLVLVKGVWCYDKARHGKTEDVPAGGKCFNCRQPLPEATEDTEKKAAAADAKKAEAAAKKKAAAEKRILPPKKKGLTTKDAKDKRKRGRDARDTKNNQ